MPLLVRSMTHESAGVLSVELVDPDGRDLPPWEPGAHLDLQLPGGLSRQYSLSGDPARPLRYRLGVLREDAGRGGSAYVHDALRPGRPRRGRRPAQPLPARAGGERTSSSPAASASRRSCRCSPQATAAGATWTLLYGGRTAASMAFTAELAAYGDRVTLWPQDTHGLLDLDGLLGTPRPDTLVYAAARSRCSPRSRSGWRLAGGRAAPRAVRGARGRARPGRRARASRWSSPSPAAPCWCRRDRSVLEVLLEAGVDVLHDCQEGICGTCEVKVIEGEVDHRDHVLSEPEQAANSCMMVCVSRACGKRLVLGSLTGACSAGRHAHVPRRGTAGARRGRGRDHRPWRAWNRSRPRTAPTPTWPRRSGTSRGRSASCPTACSPCSGCRRSPWR